MSTLIGFGLHSVHNWAVFAGAICEFLTTTLATYARSLRPAPWIPRVPTIQGPETPLFPILGREIDFAL